MQNLERVPCLNVTKENFESIWPHLIDKISTSSFVGIDFEFSGLGDKIDYEIKDLEIRYKLLAEIVKDRSLMSIGLSFFEYEDPKQTLEEQRIKRKKKLEDGELENEVWRYRVSNFNIFCECEGEYVKEDQAVEFLRKHGFDFQVHSSQAIKYAKGNDQTVLNENEISLRNLFVKIISRKRPIILHNGLLDLLYLYHHLYCELPGNVQTFLCDLNELFKSGIYDTKYICEINTDLKISFLEYLFYYVQRMNILKIAYNDDNIIMAFSQLTDKLPLIDHKFFDYGNLKTLILKDKPEGLEICKNYRNYGWCKEREDCTKSHNIDYILDAKFENSKNQKRYAKDLQKMKELNENEETKINNGIAEIIRFNEKGGVHSAGYDAFMTSFCFAYFVLEYFEDMPIKMEPGNIKHKLKMLVNRIYLPFTHKHTLLIKKSDYINNSRNHRIKIDQIFVPKAYVPPKFQVNISQV